jgi:hypothetical protein
MRVMMNSARTVVATLCMLLGIVSWISNASAQAPSLASAGATSQAGDSALLERAAEFWAARVAGDSEKQWQFLEPRGKGRITASEYGAAPTGGRYLAYQVEDATVNGFFGTVKVRLLIQQFLPGPGPALGPQVSVVDDGWIRVRGVWYRRFEDVGRSPSPQQEQ